MPSHRTGVPNEVAGECVCLLSLCSPNDGKCWQLLQIKREIHTKVCPEQSRDGYWKKKKKCPNLYPRLSFQFI